MHRRSERRRRQADTDVVHPTPDPGIGERVPLQPVPHAAQTHRGRPSAQPHRATDQNLVPEPAHEVEKGLPPGARRRQGRAASAAAAEYVTSGAAPSPPPSSPAGAQYPSAARARAPLSAAACRRPGRDVLLQ